MTKEFTEITFGELHDLVKNEKIFLDDTFQRKGGYTLGSGWKSDNFSAYIHSILSGQYANKIVVVRIPQSCEWILEKGMDIEHGSSLDYYENLKNLGYDLLSVDGWNTTSCVHHFIKGDFAIKQESQEFYFQDLNPHQQRRILDSKIQIEYRTGLTKDQVAELFRLMNSSTALNDQERRQARFTEFASSIRGFGDQLVDVFYNFVYNNVEHLDQRMHEESVAIWVQARNKQWSGMTSKKLDKLYENTLSLQTDEKANMQNVIDVLVLIAKKTGKCPSGQQLTRGGLITLAIVIEKMLQDYSLVAGREKDFYDHFSLICKKVKDLSKDQKDCSRYEKWLTAFHSGYAERTINFNKELFENIFRHTLLKAGIIQSNKLSDTSQSPQQNRTTVQQVFSADLQALTDLWKTYEDKYNKMQEEAEAKKEAKKQKTAS